MNQVANSELAAQNQFAKQGQGVLANSISKSTPQTYQQQQGIGAKAAEDAYQGLQANKPGQLALTGSQINPNTQAAATENNLVQGRVNNQNQAAANLQGYNQAGLSQNLKDISADTQLGQIGTFAQQRANLLPLQLQAAQNSQSGLSGIGSLLQTGGGLLGLYGAINAAPSAVAGGAGTNQLAGLSSGYGPVSGQYAKSLFGSGALNGALQNQTLAGLGYGGSGSLSTFGGW